MKLRKAICGIVMFLTIIAAGGLSDKAFVDEVELTTYLTQIGICLAVMIIAFFVGRLYEDCEKN